MHGLPSFLIYKAPGKVEAQEMDSELAHNKNGKVTKVT